MRVQASLEFLLIGSAVAAMCLFVVTFYSKNLFSQSSVLATIADSSTGVTYYPQPSFLSGYSESTTTVTPQYVPVIANRSEKLVYAIGHPSYVANLTQFSHCASAGFYGHAFNVSGQCGTANAWDYLAGYDCPRSGAYCIIPHNTSYATESVSGSRSLVYSFTLSIASPSGVLVSQLNSSQARSPVMLGGSVVGSASVSSASSTDPYANPTLIYFNGSYSLANQTYYALYSQEKGMLYPMLAFYNGTSVDSATQASIEETIGAYASAQLHFLNSTGGAVLCAVSASRYVCGAASPFLYLINVTLSQSIGQVNQTIYYLGSVIGIRS